MFTYAVLTMTPKTQHRLKLVATHGDEFGAWSAYRRTDPPAVLVRLDEDQSHSSYDVTVVAAKGAKKRDLQTDLRFRTAVIQAAGGR
jgi:hypothetical protein